jgi:hypothetical protein
MRKQYILLMVLFICTNTILANSKSYVQVQSFPIAEDTSRLEKQHLDFRFQPHDWQICIGLPDDPHKSVVFSDGTIYYDFIHPSNKDRGLFRHFRTQITASLLSSTDTIRTTQRIWNGKVPVVHTKKQAGDIRLDQHIWANAPEEDALTQWAPERVDYLWLILKNTGQQTQKSQIILQIDSQDSLKLDEDGLHLVYHDNPHQKFCAFSSKCEQIAIAYGIRSNRVQIRYPAEFKPGESKELLIAFFRGEQASVYPDVSQAELLRNQAIAYWESLDLPYDRIRIPDEKMQTLLESCIRNIYQAREIKDGKPTFQVGPTYYRGTWAVDGAFILEAITYLGLAEQARPGLELQLKNVGGPGGVAFSKKSGIRLWAILRHAQLTGDSLWLESVWQNVLREVNMIKFYRDQTRIDPEAPNYGLMPRGFGDGGLRGMLYEYTNTYWNLAGLKAAIQIAERLGKGVLPHWQREYDDFWQTFERARHRDMLLDGYGNLYVPVTMKGEKPTLPQRGAWSFLHSIFPGRIFEHDDALMRGTLAMLDGVQEQGNVFGTGWQPDGVWTYFASFYGHAHLWLGHGKKAAATLYAFANHACPLYVWSEEQSLTGERGKRFGNSNHRSGDMPHNWASAEFIRMIRHLLLLERGDDLHVLPGLPHTWTQPGETIQMKQIPTCFGTVDLDVKMETNKAVIRIDPPKREPVEKIVIHTEHFQRPIRQIELNGTSIKGNLMEFDSKKPFQVDIEFE